MPQTQFADLGQTPEDVKRAEPDDDDPYWSVTTLLGVLDKPALLDWAAEQSARAAVAVVDSLAQRVAEDGPDATVKWLRDARFRRPRDQVSATSLGSAVHAACEDYALTGVRPDRDRLELCVRLAEPEADAETIAREAEIVARTVDRFDDVFLQRFGPEYLATEVTVYSPSYGYAGTADGFVVVDGRRLILDYKTSRESYDARGKPRGPYPEVALQLAAYRYAELAAVWRPRRVEQYRRRYYLLGPDERAAAVPVPDVEGGVVVHLSPERCGVYPIECGTEVHRAFLFVVELNRYLNTIAPKVIGDELVPPEAA